MDGAEGTMPTKSSKASGQENINDAGKDQQRGRKKQKTDNGRKASRELKTDDGGSKQGATMSEGDLRAETKDTTERR